MDGLRRPLLLTWSIDRGVGGSCHLAATSDILNPDLGCGPAGYGRVRYAAAPTMKLRGRVQPGVGDASKWLRFFADSYARKTGTSVFPGSLNLNLGAPFDWHKPYVAERHIWFDRSEMGGERDVLLVPCVLTNLSNQPAFLWSTTNAAADRADPWVVEVICEVGLRDTFSLVDGDPVDVKIP